MPVEGGKRTKGINRSSTTEQPLISILTVVFNGAKSIERTIKSVIKQDYSNLEYIIVDGKSTDQTLRIVKTYEDSIDYYISEPDDGIYHAMNKGIGLCNGEIIGIINSDDWYEANIFSKIVNEYKNDSECIQHGLLRLHDQDGPISVQSYYASRLSQHMIMHPTCFVPSHFYNTFGMFNTDYRIAADYDLILRFYTNNVHFNLIQEVLANFTMGGACQSNDSLATKESIKIRLMNGVITKSRYKRIMLKTMLSSQKRRLRDLIKRLLRI